MAAGAFTRIKLPKSAAAGSTVTIKALINHRMESGFRIGHDGNVVPRSIINRFVVDFNGENIMDVALGPLVATDPYFQFDAVVPESGEFTFVWHDDDGSVLQSPKKDRRCLNGNACVRSVPDRDALMPCAAGPVPKMAFLTSLSVFCIGAVPCPVAGRCGPGGRCRPRRAAVSRNASFCHKLDPAKNMRLGPPLNAVFSAPAGAVEGFEYSVAMQQAALAGLRWTPESLDAYIANPKRFLPKTKMAFAGLRSPRDRTDIIAFLEQASLEGGAQIADIVVPPEILAIEGDPEYGAYLASECVTCHRADGADKGIPPVAGLNVETFVTAMHSYRGKHREHPVMQMIANRLSNDEIAALAAYFAELHH